MPDLSIHDTGTSVAILGYTTAGRRFIQDHPQATTTAGEPVIYLDHSQLDALFDLIDQSDLASQTTF